MDTTPHIRTRLVRGQSLVEFALALPVMLLIFMGVMDFGRVLMTYAQSSAAVRNALRYGVIIGYQDLGGTASYTDCEGMRDAASRVFFAENTSVDIHFNMPQEDGSTDTLICDYNNPNPQNIEDSVRNGDILEVVVASDVRTMTPFLPEFLHVVMSGQRTIVKSIELQMPTDLVPTPDLTSPAQCGNNICEVGETALLCPTDCAECGDSSCNVNYGNVCEVVGDCASNYQEPVNLTVRLESPGGSMCASDDPAVMYVGLDWSDVQNATGYHIYAKPDGGDITWVGTATQSQCGGSPYACFNKNQAFWDTHFDKRITYQVVAFNGQGKGKMSAFSMPVTYTCGKVTKISYAPQATVCQQSSTWIGLQWQPSIPGADGYEVRAITPSGTTYIVGAIESGTQCGYSVAGTTDVNGTTWQGCYNINPGIWPLIRNLNLHYRVVPYRGPYDPNTGASDYGPQTNIVNTLPNTCN